MKEIILAMEDRQLYICNIYIILDFMKKEKNFKRSKCLKS